MKYEIRNTGSGLMSTAERPMQKVELGKLVSSVIRHPSFVSCISFLPSRSVLILDTCYYYLNQYHP